MHFEGKQRGSRRARDGRSLLGLERVRPGQVGRTRANVARLVGGYVRADGRGTGGAFVRV